MKPCGGDVDCNDKWYYPAYDEAWRMVAVFRESDTAPKEEFVPHLAGADGYGGSSLLDGVILRYKDANTAWTSASDGTLEEKRYYCQNWRGDVVAIVSSAGAMYEWVKYSPYGIPFGLPAADTESDGDCDATDITQIQTWINGSAYDVRGDLDLDGDVDTTDKSTAQGSFQGITLGAHVLSNVGSRKGFTGHERAMTIASHWHARNRVFDSNLGHWAKRDPLGYVESVTLYDYVGARPMDRTDPLGLLGDASGVQLPAPTVQIPPPNHAIPPMSPPVEKVPSGAGPISPTLPPTSASPSEPQHGPGLQPGATNPPRGKYKKCVFLKEEPVIVLPIFGTDVGYNYCRKCYWRCYHWDTNNCYDIPCRQNHDHIFDHGVSLPPCKICGEPRCDSQQALDYIAFWGQCPN